MNNFSQEITKMDESMESDTAKDVVVRYTNYRGETDNRRIRPIRIWFGNNEWHSEPQWLIDVVDLERNVERTFAMNAIQAWGESL